MAANGNLEASWKMLEHMTRNAHQIQQEVLAEILTHNVHTEYLHKFLNGHSDKQSFKNKVPIINYEDIKSYMVRITNGEPSHILLADPIVELNLSSGTSLGENKILPTTAKDLERRAISRTLHRAVMNKFVDGLEQGKATYLSFAVADIKTPSGLIMRPSSSSYLKSEYFQKLVSNVYTSPYETILCLDSKQSMYCQLLSSLIRRDEVVSLGAPFAYMLVKAIRFLEEYWRDLCRDIKRGELSDRITDPSCRTAFSSILSEPNPQLAESIESACSRKSWEGIVKQLWPKTKYIHTIVTGAMAQYIPTLEFYCGGLPLVSLHYSSSECYIAINLEPFTPPSQVSYTLLPNMAYYEFLPVKENNMKLVENDQCLKGIYDHGQGCIDSGKDNGEIEPVELADVKIGERYEIVVTTYTGLYRYRVGDILMVTGFHNNTPQFPFIRRQNVLLCVAADKTSEEDLFKAVKQAKLLIEPFGLILRDYTSYADISSIRGHYVIFWELEKKGSSVDEVDLNYIIEQCCYKMEESLDFVYRYQRKCEITGALEIRVVKNGTFDALMDFAISKGSSVGQYKTPRCIKSEEALKIMDSGVIGTYFSQSNSYCK